MSYLSQGCEDQDRPLRAEQLLTLAVRGGPGPDQNINQQTDYQGKLENWPTINDETQKFNEHYLSWAVCINN